MRPDSGPSARARFVPRRLSSGRDRNFSTVLPTGFDIFGTRAASSSSASGSTSKYNRANICPWREATAERSVPRSLFRPLPDTHRRPPHPVICLTNIPWPRVGSGSKGLIFDYRPSVCPPDELSKLDYYYAACGGRGRLVEPRVLRIPSKPSELVPPLKTIAVNKLSPCPLDRGKVARTCKSRFNYSRHANKFFNTAY